jgi:hypothetical protein
MASIDAPAHAVPVERPLPPGLTTEQMQKLQKMLRELTECRKLLDAALSEREAPP